MALRSRRGPKALPRDVSANYYGSFGSDSMANPFHCLNEGTCAGLQHAFKGTLPC